jgi:SnoaL-like polyketide cyclase
MSETSDELPIDAPRIVIDSVRAALGESFEGEVEFDREVADGNPLSYGAGEGPDRRDTVGVAWLFTGRHTGHFVGIDPTGVDVRIVGMTVLQTANGETIGRSYIDWHYVLAQLGSVPSRTVLPFVRET